MPESTRWKVLVAEDRAGISASLLRSRPDFDVSVVHRLQAVERLVREHSFEAALLDLSLADLANPQGLDAYRRLRAMAPGLPIVVLAGPGGDEASMTLAGEGAAACLPRAATLEVLAWTLRQAAIRSQAEARRYKTLFDSVPIGILLAAGRRVAMANPAFLTALGYAFEDMAHLSVVDLFPPGLRSSLESALDAAVAGEAREASFATWVRDKGGAAVPAQVFLKGALLNDAPALALYLAFPPAGEAAARAVKMEALGRLAAGIAHDFNNVITAVNGYSDHLMSLPAAQGAMARGLQAIRKAGDAAIELTRGLSAFSETGTPAAAPVRVDAALDQAAPALGALLGGPGRLRLDPRAGDALVPLEPGRLEQALLALCENARDAMPGGGEVSISTAKSENPESFEFTHLHPRAEGPYVVIRVRDTGEGMGPDVLERLFEPYFTTRRARGRGLGLAWVYGLVSRAGGGLAVRSAPGEGSEVRIWLPCAVPVPGPADAQPAAPAQAAPSYRAGTGEPGPARRKTVLAVEDDPGLREMLHAVLERFGFEAREAVSGSDAEEMLAGADEFPDLILTDVSLMDGLGTDLVARLRADHPALRALFISGHSLDILADQGIRLSPGEFLEKPFTPTQLAARVREALEAPAPDKASAAASAPSSRSAPPPA